MGNCFSNTSFLTLQNHFDWLDSPGPISVYVVNVSISDYIFLNIELSKQMGLPYNFHSLEVYIHDSTGRPIYVSYFKITIIRLYVV